MRSKGKELTSCLAPAERWRATAGASARRRRWEEPTCGSDPSGRRSHRAFRMAQAPSCSLQATLLPGAKARRGGGPEHGCVRRARQIRRRPRWCTPAVRFGLWGARRRSPRPRAARGVVMACAPPLLPSLRDLSLSLTLSLSCELGPAAGEALRRSAGGGSHVGRTAAAGSWGARRWPAHGGRREVG